MLLIRQYGSLADLNQAVGLERNAPQLARIKNANARLDRGTVYTMGDQQARDIEEKLGLERGWMDTPPTYTELTGEDDPKAKLMLLMEQIPQEDWPKAVRLLGALAEPAPLNGTNH